jgi:hypothetical protein
MPSHPSMPKTLAGDPGLATAGGTPALQSPSLFSFCTVSSGALILPWRIRYSVLLNNGVAIVSATVPKMAR